MSHTAGHTAGRADTAHAEALTDQAARDGVQKLVAGALVHDTHGQVLILRRADSDDFLAGIEELPSGGVEPGEMLLAALARELSEETGLPLQGPLRYVGSFDYRSGSGRLARQHTWAIPHPGHPVRLSGEHTSHRMVPAQQIRTCGVTDETAQVVETWADDRTDDRAHQSQVTADGRQERRFPR